MIRARRGDIAKLVTLPPTPGQPGGTAAPTMQELASGFRHNLCRSYRPPDKTYRYEYKSKISHVTFSAILIDYNVKQPK